MGLAGHSPRSLVGMQHGGVQCLRLNLFVPGKERLLQAPPEMHQSAAGQLHLQMIVEDIDDLGNRVAQAVVHPRGHDGGAAAQPCSGQGVGNLRFHQLLAARAPVAMDRMFGHDRSDSLGNVFDVTLPRCLAALQSPLAVRTARQPMVASLVDPCRWSAMMALVARLRPRLLASLRCRFLIPRNHARRRGRSGLSGIQGGQLPRHDHKAQNHRLLSVAVDCPRLVLRQRRAKQLVEIHFRACRAHTSIYENTLT